MMDYSSPPAGYVLRRNGTCTETEQTCDHPWASWYNCCPVGSYCSDDRMICCKTKSGCAAVVKEDPHCANNATWDLYYNNGAYFCCLHGKQGFVETFPGDGGAGIGCADGELDNASQSLLQVIATGESRLEQNLQLCCGDKNGELTARLPVTKALDPHHQRHPYPRRQPKRTHIPRCQLDQSLNPRLPAMLGLLPVALLVAVRELRS